MAQDWARAFYHSPAWRKNRATYINAVIDTSGNVLDIVEGDGTLTYIRRSDGTAVPDSQVVPPGVCERCFRLGVLTPAKVVHHKTHLTPENVNDAHVTLAYDNFERLCQDCHAIVHSGRTEPSVMFDESGNVVANPRMNSIEALVMSLTETADERRNIHERSRND